jgi:hypothetical protein
MAVNEAILLGEQKSEIDQSSQYYDGEPQSSTIDLGGVVIDLSGGRYLINNSITVPAGVSNLRIQSGTLLASASFNQSAYMIYLGWGYCDAYGTMSCTGLLSVHQVVLDGSGVALGGIRADTIQLGEIDSCLILGFTTYGINLDGSGGMFVHDSWIGQYSLFDPVRLTNVTATCLYMNGSEHDSVIRDVIIFSGRIGILAHSGGNVIMAVHVWNLAATQGGIGMLVRPGVRITDCYFDFTPLVIEDPAGVIVSNSFFLGCSSIVITSTAPSLSVSELQITGNWFHSTNTTILVEGPFPFTSLYESVIENNVADSGIVKTSTRATMACWPSGEASCTMDFKNALAFPSIDIAEARCFVQSDTPVAFSWTIAAQSLTVTATNHFTGKVMCDVDQSTRWHAAH